MTWNVQPHHVAAGVVDVFGEYIETEHFRPAPVRTILVTPEIQAADVLDRMQRLAKVKAPTAAWAIKDELRAENLVRKAAPKKRVAKARTPRSRTSVAKPNAETMHVSSELLRVCDDAGTQIAMARRAASRAAASRRYRDRKVAEAGKTCLACGVPLKWTNTSGACGTHTPSICNLKTVMHAADKQEWAVNMWWSMLPVETRQKIHAALAAGKVGPSRPVPDGETETL